MQELVRGGMGSDLFVSVTDTENLLAQAKELQAEVERMKAELSRWVNLATNLRHDCEQYASRLTAADEQVARLKAELAAAKQQCREALEIPARLRRRADLYQAADGTPGPLSDQWGWRDMARMLRAAADAVLAAGEAEKGADDAET
jgi:predicted RNase H-like nuclease (RuvC/YqgF family)